MARRRKRRRKRDIDVTGEYAAVCLLLAIDLGLDPGDVYNCWAQLSLMRRFEQGLGRAVAEDGAWRDVRAILERDGAEPN